MRRDDDFGFYSEGAREPLGALGYKSNMGWLILQHHSAAVFKIERSEEKAK